MKHKILFLLICSTAYCLLPTAYCYSQDIHFSQFNYSPLNLNPTLTGNFPWDFRVVGNHRNQWQSITVPFVTTSFSFDMNLFNFIENEEKFFKQDKIGIGVIVNQDKAGDSEFGTTQFNLSAAYHKNLNAANTQVLSFGIQFGLAQRGLKYDKLTFDNQYDGIQYNPNLGNNENFIIDNFVYMDLSAGINWTYRPKERFKSNIGFGIFHLNQPSQSFFENNDITLDPKYTFHGSCKYEITQDFSLLPSFMLLRQGTFNEMNIGTNFKYTLKARFSEHLMTTDVDIISLNMGVAGRMKDALICLFGVDYNNLFIGFSYDINLSKLREASNKKGGYELAVVCYFPIKEIKPLRTKYKLYCPSFL